MRALFLMIFAVLATDAAGAAHFEVRGQKGETLWQGETDPALPCSVGDLSVETFTKNTIPYQGDATSISEIFGLGLKVEAPSEDEMRVYGWCYSVNGEIPSASPDQVQVPGKEAKIVWFYAYAQAYKGAWLGQCFVDEDDQGNGEVF